MASIKTSVVYVKRVEDRDKKGQKVVIPEGTKAELTEDELRRVRHAVRILDNKKPANEVAAAAGQSAV